MKIIAEVGSNFKTLEDCRNSIRIAKACGADYVKFQTYTHKELYGFDGDLKCEPDLESLARVCRGERIGFMCTAFSSEGYRRVNELVKIHKVASSEITDLNLLATVNSFRKPVILSCGGATPTEIDAALFALRSCKVTLLYCVVAYPAKIVDFRHLDQLMDNYEDRCDFGYSDHSIDVLNIPKIARDRGCVIIEKHVNFTEHKDTPDAPHSLNTEEFHMMCRHLKGQVHATETHSGNAHKRRRIVDDQGHSHYYRPKL